MEKPEQVVVAYKDKKVGLIVCGVIQLLLALLCLLLIAVMGAGLMIQGKMHGGSPALHGNGALIPALAVYGGMAVFFGWMGVGSMLGRRWARALMLVNSVYWLATGIFGTAFMLYLVPHMMSAAPGRQGQLPAAATFIVTAIMVVFMSLFFIILPGAFVLFYRSPHVKATCERLDPKERWTDRAPLPVLGLSVLLAGYGACDAMMIGSSTMPVFGYVLKGPLALGGAMIGVAVFGLLAVRTFQLRAWAWTASLALMLLWGLSSFVTSLRMSPEQLLRLYSSGEVSPESAQILQAFGPHAMLTMQIAVLLPTIGFLLYVKKCFKAPSSEQIVET